MASSIAANISSSTTLEEECAKAFRVISHPYAQFVRFLFLPLLIFQFALFLVLAFGFKRKKLVLHGNLKFLYVNLAILYQFAPFGYFLAEIRHMVLALFFQDAPCFSLFTPIWFVFLSRGAISIYNYSIPLVHFCIMLERLRATMLAAKRYEFEGINFGISMVLIIVYFPVFAITLLVSFMVYADNDNDFTRLLPVNSLTSKSSNLPVQIFTYFLIAIVILTAISDFFIFRRNKVLKRQRIAPIQMPSNGGGGGIGTDGPPPPPPSSPMPQPYNLSEKYQLLENERAMKLILPLDIAYMLSYLAYSILVLILRANQPTMDYAIYIAHYNAIASILTIYTISSLFFFRRFLLQNLAENRRQMGQKSGQIVVPVEMMGRLYFDQLKTQWDYSPPSKNKMDKRPTAKRPTNSSTGHNTAIPIEKPNLGNEKVSI